MSQAIRDSIYAKWIASQGAGTVYAAVGGRLYETAAPQMATAPCLVYSVTADPVETFMGGYVSESATLDVAIFVSKGNQDNQEPGGGSDGAIAAGAIEEKVYTLLHGVSLTCSGRDRALVTCLSRGVPSIEDDAHVNRSAYLVRATKVS